MIKHIQQQLSKYSLYYFDVIAECDKNKRIYKNNYKVARKLEKSIIQSKAENIELAISDEIMIFLAMFYCK